MKPEVVVFDLGRVLLDFDYSIAARRIAARGRLSAEAMQEIIDHSPLLFRFERGELDNEQFFQEVCAASGFSGDYAEFAGFFADIFTPIKPMVELHAELRARHVPTFIFSNTNGIAIGHILTNFPFLANFDGHIYSYEHGAMKPDPKIYQVVERTARAEGERILFLDDREENVRAAMERGWQAIHHQTPGATRAIIRAMKLLVSGA